MAMRNIYVLLILMIYYLYFGDDRCRRRWKALDRKPRGAELAKSAYLISAKNTTYATLPLAA